MENNLVDLTSCELENTQGGGFLEDLAHAVGYGVGYTVGAAYNLFTFNPLGGLQSSGFGNGPLGNH